jgi:O-acetyl-ADP-ribose deacetylase (regulator of RNase III)
MIHYVRGDLFRSNAEALVNPVNTVGVMGKGLALQFRERFPGLYPAYQKACQRGEVRIGRVFVFDRGPSSSPRFILNFPTKAHWKDPSRLEYIRAGLVDLVRVVRELGIRSLAVPALGAGLGGLDWREVKPLIEEALGDLEGVEVWVYEPLR